MIGPLAEYALKSSLVLVTCGAVSWMLRHRSSALRHALWSAALAATIILGPLSAVTPPLKIPLFPRAIAAATTRNHSGGRGTMPAGEAARATLPEHVVSPSRPVHGRSRVDGSTLIRAISAVAPIAWLIGVMAQLGRMLTSRVRLRQLRKQAARIVAPRFQALIGEIGRGIRMTGEVELLSSGRVRTPVAFGILRPAVMLPAGADSWSNTRLRIVLTHELAHIRRRDALTHVIGELAGAIHWYNPLVWYAVDRLILERERACDDEVVQGGTPGIDYAHHLVSLARHMVARPGHLRNALTVAHAVNLDRRVKALLMPALRRGRLTPAQGGVITAHFVAAVFALTLVGPVSPSVEGAAASLAERPRPLPVGISAPRRLTSPDRRRELPPRSSAPPSRIHSEPVAESQPVAPPSTSGARAGEHPDPEPEPEPHTADALADPRSEVIEIANPRALWPSDQEINTSSERHFIERLRAAAEHEKTFEYDFVRERAEWALTRVRGAAIVAPLVEALGDRDWRVQANAAWALAAIDALEAARSILPLLEHENWRVRAQAASSLLDLGATLNLDLLSRLSRDPAWQVRISVVEFLRRAGGPEAQELLDRMACVPHGGTRMEVEAARAEFGAR